MRRARPASGEEDRRQPPALRARPGILEPDHLQQLEQPLARRALVPVAVAADDLEQLVGGAVAVARAISAPASS
jgi:hypothetical protein